MQVALTGTNRPANEPPDALVSVRRADLQGLRAVAVLAVIAFHFGIPGLPGGFAGVDIFFVLSGFFITRLLVRELEQEGRIRLARFWANRMKRLLPNSLLVILVVLVAATLLLPAYRLAGLSGDAVAAAAFFANFHFAAQTVDYFRLDDQPGPLLHYWSLAVEEQFYLVLPLLLLGVGLLPALQRRKAVIALLLLVIASSFIASLVVIERSQPEAFFQPQYRAWQLALGGLVGLVFGARERLPTWLRSAGAALGMVLVTGSLLLLNEGLSYPGIWALAPTAGTALLVFGLGSGRLGQGLSALLSLRPVVWIGDISYSLYLWHWPIAVFIPEVWPDAGALGIIVGLALTTWAACLAYYLLEYPIHHRPLADLRLPKVLAAGIGGVALMVAVALGTGALPGRSDPEITARIAAATADLGENYANRCHRGLNDADQPSCSFATLGGPRVVLFGDSHAAQWFTGLVRAGDIAGWQVDAWTKSGCPAARFIVWHPPARSIYETCDKWREERLATLLADPPALVVIGNSSRYYGWVYDDSREGSADDALSERLWALGVRETTELLVEAGIAVVELRDTPHMYTSYKDCLSYDLSDDCGRTRDEALSGMAVEAFEHPLYTRLDLTDALCSPNFFSSMLNGAIAYRDSEHLTASQAGLMYSHFLPLLQQRVGALDAASDRE